MLWKLLNETKDLDYYTNLADKAEAGVEEIVSNFEKSFTVATQ